MNEPRAVSGYHLAKQISEALGIDPARVQRLVIDVQAGSAEPVKVYFQMVGDVQLLKVDWSPDSVKIVFADKKEST